MYYKTSIREIAIEHLLLLYYSTKMADIFLSLVFYLSSPEELVVDGGGAYGPDHAGDGSPHGHLGVDAVVVDDEDEESPEEEQEEKRLGLETEKDSVALYTASLFLPSPPSFLNRYCSLVSTIARPFPGLACASTYSQAVAMCLSFHFCSLLPRGAISAPSQERVEPCKTGC